MQKLSFVDETFDLNFTSEYHLSIQFSLDGFSFCILDGIQKKYVALSNKPGISANSPLLVKHLNEHYQEEDKLLSEFKSSHIVFASPKATLIPKAFYNQQNNSKYTELNFGKNQDEDALNQPLFPYMDELVFSVPKKLCNFITEKHSGVIINHECKPFLWNASNSVSNDKFIAILIRKDYIWLVYIENNTIKFFNSFYYKSDEDIIYFTLNIVSLLNIDVEKTPVFLEGMVSKKAAIYHRIRQYIKHIQLSNASQEYHYSYLFDQLPDSRFVTMLNLQACEL